MSTEVRGPLGSSETEITKESICHPLLLRSRQRVASLIDVIWTGGGDRLVRDEIEKPECGKEVRQKILMTR